MKEKKKVKPKRKRIAPAKLKKKYITWNPWVPPAPMPTYTEEVRRMEYLNSITELSGSTEGNELGSLGSLSQDLNKEVRYDVEFEEIEADDFEL